MFALRLICVAYVVWYHSSRAFYIFLCILWLVTTSSDMADVWPYDPVTLIIVLRIEREVIWKEKEKENENEKEMKIM